MDSSLASTVSSSRDSDAESTLTGDSGHYRALCKDMLKKQVFLGHFTEKKFIPAIEGYRDVIQVDESEAALCGRLLDFVRSRLQRTIDPDHTWIGITLRESPAPLIPNRRWSLTTQLPDGLAFGEYLFKVKTISFKPNEIYLKLRIVYDRDGSETPAPAPPPANIQLDDVINTIAQLAGDLRRAVDSLWATRRQITVRSCLVMLKNIVQYSVAALLVFVLFIAESIPSIGRFALRLSREIRGYIIVLTPLFQGALHLANNIVGGFYILLAMIWRDSVNGLTGRRATNRPEGGFRNNMIENEPHWKRYRKQSNN